MWTASKTNQTCGAAYQRQSQIGRSHHALNHVLTLLSGRRSPTKGASCRTTFTFQPSHDCLGTADTVQQGTATTPIDVGAIPMYFDISVHGAVEGSLPG